MSRAKTIEESAAELRRLKRGLNPQVASTREALRADRFNQPHEIARAEFELRARYDKQARETAIAAVADSKRLLLDLADEIDKERGRGVKAKDPAQVMALVAGWTAEVDACRTVQERVLAAQEIVRSAKATKDPDAIRAARTALTRSLEKDSGDAGSAGMTARDLRRELRDLAANPKLAELEQEHAEVQYAQRMLMGEIGALRDVVAPDPREWSGIEDVDPTPKPPLSQQAEALARFERQDPGGEKLKAWSHEIVQQGERVVAERKARAAETNTTGGR